MTTANIKTRNVFTNWAAVAFALAALGFAVAAQARDNVSFSFGVGINNAYPVYTEQPIFVQQPVYVQPQPFYVQPQQVYVQPQTIYVAPRQVYYGQPVYQSPQPVYYVSPNDYGRNGGGFYQQQSQWNNGYSQPYYRREGSEGRHHDRDD